MHLRFRKTCRVCGSSKLTRVIDMGEQFLQGSFIKPGKELPPMRKIPTALVRCDCGADENGCGLLQMGHSVPPSILYSAYWYRSATNQTMRDHLSGITSEVTEMLRGKQLRALDIGCNDGTLLRSYPAEFEKWGVDPSDVADEQHENIHVVRDLFPSTTLIQAIQGRKFDLVTSIAMFYDLEDPVGFAKAVASLLSPTGIWAFEMSYMPTMLKMNSYDTICHEHLEYYSLAVLENILQRAGLRIAKVSLNDINGGSIRLHAVHATDQRFRPNDLLQELRQEEFELELDTDKPYLAFQKRIEEHRKTLLELLNRLRSQGKRIHIYGASTKGNTLLQWCGIDKSIVDFAADRNPEKHGAMTLGTEIPIISEAESRAMKPDYYLVLPWHFQREFLERERDAIASGTGMIFPLPAITVVTKQGVTPASQNFAAITAGQD